jgi:hypothetical protein
MKYLGIVLLGAVAVAAALGSSPGCGGSGGSGGASGSASTSSSATASTSSSGTGAGGSGGATTHPPPPALGVQIDRIGRPAINTALDHAFDGNTTTAGAAKDAYNADSDPAQWVGNHAAELAQSLAILDALDGTCGNQLAYAAPPSATSYTALAGALADDRLWLNTAGTTCLQYLAVEVDALGVKTSSDCGGRALAYDVVDTTYSVVASGALSGLGDGVSTNDVPFLTTFPYLAPPH